MTTQLTYNMTFADFQALQSHMARRTFSKNKASYAPALLGVVICALLLVLVIVICARPFRYTSLFGLGYPLGFYSLVAILLLGAILALIPAVRLRLRTLRMQVTDTNPLFGPGTMRVEEDGLVIDRNLIRTFYRWPAFNTVEIIKGAVILAIDTGMGVIIPASAFASDAERYEFAAAVSQHLKMTGVVAA